MGYKLWNLEYMGPVGHKLLDPEFPLGFRYSDGQDLDHKDRRSGRAGAGPD